MDQLW